MNRLKKFLTDTADSLLRVALRYPVEAALCIYACIFGAIQIEWSFDYHMLLAADGAATEMRQLPDGIFTMLPLTMLATLVVHTLVGRASRAWRTLYLLVPLLLTIASWLLGKEWFGTSQFFITSAVLAPLGLLMARRTLPNGPFVRQTLGYIRAAVVGGIFALTAMLSAMAIYHSVIYIFNIPASWEVRNLVDSYIVLFSWALLWPLTALARLDGYLSDEPQGTKTTDTLLNWILAPALLVYAAILYLYCLQILFTWSLPKGGVAYLVFGFTMALFTVKALQELVVRRRYDWFFDRISIFALPPLVLFWAGVMQRVGDYGLTELARLPHRLRRDHDRSRRTLRRTPHRTLLLHRRNGLRPLLPDGLHSPLLGHGVSRCGRRPRAPSGWPAKRGCSTNPADSICPASTNATRRSSNVIASSTPRSTTSTTTIRCCWPTASASPAPANSSAASIATGSETISSGATNSIPPKRQPSQAPTRTRNSVHRSASTATGTATPPSPSPTTTEARVIQPRATRCGSTCPTDGSFSAVRSTNCSRSVATSYSTGPTTSRSTRPTTSCSTAPIRCSSRSAGPRYRAGSTVMSL